MAKRINHRSQSLRYVIIIALIIVLAAGYYFFHGEKHVSKKVLIPSRVKSVVSGNSQTSKSTVTDTSPPSQNTSHSSASSNPQGNVNNSAPDDPTGNFVSSHTVRLSGNDTELSTCIVSPDDYCTITFTNDSMTESLGPLESNGNGVVSWTWTPQELHLTQGSWEITAIASNTSSIKSQTSDPNPLIVTN